MIETNITPLYTLQQHDFMLAQLGWCWGCFLFISRSSDCKSPPDWLQIWEQSTQCHNGTQRTEGVNAYTLGCC